MLYKDYTRELLGLKDVIVTDANEEGVNNKIKVINKNAYGTKALYFSQLHIKAAINIHSISCNIIGQITGIEQYRIGDILRSSIAA